ncbi:hypothetical protein RJ639_020588 [Escallonia herrerae]|uniref:Chromo domain-containing protein n=1 Tax=Escallonia herrerae TaxID=1293975 RepID=A0AA89AFP0_9ASTE|nr:hypothetical protein RJ639_020588 [Escallonia herrerae]
MDNLGMMLGYAPHVGFYYKILGRNIQCGLVHMATDEDCFDMCCTLPKNRVAQVYIRHPIPCGYLPQPEVVQDNALNVVPRPEPKVVTITDTDDENDGNDGQDLGLTHENLDSGKDNELRGDVNENDNELSDAVNGEKPEVDEVRGAINGEQPEVNEVRGAHVNEEAADMREAVVNEEAVDVPEATTVNEVQPEVNEVKGAAVNEEAAVVKDDAVNEEAAEVLEAATVNEVQLEVNEGQAYEEKSEVREAAMNEEEVEVRVTGTEEEDSGENGDDEDGDQNEHDSSGEHSTEGSDELDSNFCEQNIEGSDNDNLYDGNVVTSSEEAQTDYDNSDELRSLSSEDDETQQRTRNKMKKPKYPEFVKVNEKDDPVFKLGMKFGSVEDLKKAIRQHAILNGKDILFKRSERYRVRAYCKPPCEWMIYGALIKGELTCQVKTFVGKHTCGRKNKNKLAHAGFLSKRYVEHFRANPDMSLSAFRELIKDDIQIQVTPWTLYRAKARALRLLQGTTVEQYNALKWFDDKTPHEWSRSYFDTWCKCDALMNNWYEAFNGAIVHARDKPILTMLEMIRSYLMNRLSDKRDWIKKARQVECHTRSPCAIKGRRVSGGIRAAVVQETVASAKKILWDSLLRKTMANTKERIDALEAQIHDMFKSDQDAPGILKQFSLRLDALEVNLEATDNTRYAESMEWEGKFQELQDRVEHHARHSGGIDWESKFQELQDRVELLSRAVVNTPAGGAEHSSRPRVPEPKSYGGARDAKELENFLFDVEQYFRAIRVDSEATKVSMAAMYLVGDAKLWWRKKYAEIEDGSCVINTWEILKRELKSQFFPENTAFNARKALLECKHTGSVREYCQAFSALMLDISDMSAVDRLFFFMEGLKPWARTELNRRRVNNLNEAIIAAESLSDYNSEPQRPPQRGNPSRGIGGKKPGSPMPNQSWGSKSSWASNSSTQQKSGVGFKAKPDASTSGEVKKPPFRGCFLCQGPHVIANCPQRQMMNAFFDNIGQVQRGEQSGSRPRHPPTDEQTDTQDYEEEDAVGAFPQWCNAVTTQVGNPKKSSTGEEPKDMPPKKKGDVPGKGLMYVDIKVNGKAIRAMVDTGATHNYISSTEVERLGLTLEKGCGRVKAINSAAQPVAGIARSVLIKIGPYEGRTNFSVVIMDDFKLILGLEFLRDTKTTVMPCTNSLVMLGNKSCVIPTISSRAGERSISALQWQELLAEFNFMLEYRTGSTNSVADALSRRAKLDQVALMAMNAIVIADIRVAINIGKKIKKALTRDPVAQQLLKLIESGKSAFEIVNGQQPLLPHTVNVPNAGKSPRAISFSEEWRQNIDLAHSYLEKTARRMKKHADKNRRSQEFNVGDKVMVKLLQQDRKFLRGRDSRLLQKYEGPLTIVKKIGKMAYKVDPPHWWSRQLHPVFHVSMLKPFYEDTADPSTGQIKRQGLKPKAAGKRVAEAILNDRVIIASRKRHQEYLVKWQGQMDEENTWERAADLSAYADKIEAYHMQKLTRASTALVGENVTGCPLHPPSTAPPLASSSAPPRPSNRRPCALTSSSSLAPMRPSSTAPARPIAVPAHVKSQQ